MGFTVSLVSSGGADGNPDLVCIDGKLQPAPHNENGEPAAGASSGGGGGYGGSCCNGQGGGQGCVQFPLVFDRRPDYYILAFVVPSYLVIA
jgi:hypothetical protein